MADQRERLQASDTSSRSAWEHTKFVDYVDGAGVRRSVSFDEAPTLAFEEASPARAFPTWRGQRHNTGWWWFATTGVHVGYESWLERDHVMLLDFDPQVIGLASQPFRLRWTQDGRDRSHVPDYFARLTDGTGVVIDCRSVDRIAARDAAVFALTERACDQLGWRYRLLHDPNPVYAANVRWLAGYRHPRYRCGRLADAVLEAFAEPRQLMQAASACGDPMAVWPVIFHLLWRGELTTDLAILLSARSLVAIPLEAEA